MRFRIVAAVLMLLMPGVASAQADAREGGSGELRVMSFNVRNSGAKDGANDWGHRKEFFFSTIEWFNPDLLGTQEVLADQ